MPLADLAFEHRMYLPLAAVVTGVIVGGYLEGQHIVQCERLSPKLATLLAGSFVILVAIALGIVTFSRNLDYHSDLSIWQDTVAKAPTNQRAYNGLGVAQVNRKQFKEAIITFLRALDIQPRYAEAHNNLGIALAGRKRYDEAIVHFQKSLRIKSDYAEAHNNLGLALAYRGKSDEAIVHYREALKIRPDYADAHNNLGLALAGRGQLDEAIHQYQNALKVKPDYAEAHYNLGNALARHGQLDEAIAHYEKVLTINPNHAPAHNNLGNALAACGQLNESIAHYWKALEISPGNPNPCNSLAWILATCPEASRRSGTKAVEMAERAVKLSDGENPAILDTLAAAYAEAGRFPEAVETAQKASNQATRQNNKALAASIEVRRQLYEAKTPFREPPPAPSPTSVRP
jgi:protein O-mannosyl-transferase